jgi:hypothetical protein
VLRNVVINLWAALLAAALFVLFICITALNITHATIVMAASVAFLAFASQIVGYFGTAPAQRTLPRKLALVLGLAAVGVSAWIGVNAIDWGNLPACSEGVRPGQPCSNGGFIVR